MFLFCRWCGYANAISFMKIENVDLDYIEQYVRDELLQRLSEKCKRNSKNLDEYEKEFFFGVYTDSIQDFKILRGQRLLLLEIASNLRQMFQTKGFQAFFKQFDIPSSFKISKSDTVTFSVGLFYGTYRKYDRKNPLRGMISPKNMVSDLFTKLEQLFKSFKSLKSVRPIEEDIIKIVKFEGSIRADVICVFCARNESANEALLQRIAVQMDKSGCWNLSNFRKHLVRHTKYPPKNDTDINETQKNDDFQNDYYPSYDEKILHSTPNNNHTSLKIESNLPSQFSEATILSLPIVDESNLDLPDCVGNGSFSQLLNQFTKQNMKLIEAALKNNEVINFMVAMVDDITADVKVVKIEGDGNCLYSAIGHQLKCIKVGSKEHRALSSGLRKQVVNHIQTNFNRYKQMLKLRLNLSDENNVVEVGKEFISKDLSQEGYWGGEETLVAVSEMFNINILIINEKGPCYFACGFDQDRKGTILLAYRMANHLYKGGNTVYNHYDSIVEISKELLYKCAKTLAEKLDKKYKFDYD